MSERLTKEERERWRREAYAPSGWDGVALEHRDNGRRLLRALDALDEMERERDEALAGVESGKRAARMCRELTDALLAIEAMGAEDESPVDFVRRKLGELAEARAACLARADERDHAIDERDQLAAELAAVHAICDDEPVPSLDADNARMSAAERVQMLMDWRSDALDEAEAIAHRQYEYICDLEPRLAKLQQERDEARKIAEAPRRRVPIPRHLPWDANANGVIDNAEELAAYAEQAGHAISALNEVERDRGTDIWSLASREDRCGSWEGALEDAYFRLTADSGDLRPALVEEYRHATPDDVDVARLAVWTWDRLGEWLSEDDRLSHDDGGPELGKSDKESPAWAALVEAIRMIVHDHCDLDDTAVVATGRQRRVMLTEDGDSVRWEDV